MLDDEPLEDLKTLFAWQVIDDAASYLTTETYMTSFDFYGRVMSGREEPSPLWKRAVGIVNGTLGEAVGQMYVKKYFPEENKTRMLALVKNLQKALGIRIENLAWMSRETKDKALEKLNAMTIKIGYPDEWRDYSALDINPEDTYYANLQRAAKFEQDYSLSFLGKPVDKKKWYMTPQTVNAYYNPSSNEICFPAGILQYPFFDMSADDAFNYGAIGVVIGHEMTHGFDDQGCQFDKDGNMVNWWTAEDKAAFDARTKVMEEAFNKIEVAPGVHANGAFTLGENIADHGGLQVSFLAFTLNEEAKPEAERLQTRDGFTPQQRFFLAYFTSPEMPNALHYLPGPPQANSMRFAYDTAQYNWGKRMRPTPRGEKARMDAEFSIERMAVIFSPVLGIEISQKNFYRSRGLFPERIIG